MVYVLNVLAEVAPLWVQAHAPTEWVERYGERLEHERLPQGEEERKGYANQAGTDGWRLLAALEEPLPGPAENAASRDDLAPDLVATVRTAGAGGRLAGGACPGGTRAHQLPPTIWMRARAGNAPRSGWDTKSTSPKLVTKMSHSSLRRSRRPMLAS